MIRLLLLIAIAAIVTAAAFAGVPWWAALPGASLGFLLVLHSTIYVTRSSDEFCHRCGGTGKEPPEDE